MVDYLKQIASASGLELSDEQVKKFQIFYEHLIEVNKVMNLTAITDPKDVVLKHFIDSIYILKYIDFKAEDRVIDVGTGAGFPGLPLAIMCPKVEFTLMDSLNKRIRFIREVCDLCDINNITAIHGRAEEMGSDSIYREQYDYCVSRAVANMSVLLEYCIPFVKKNGLFISYKSTLAEDELEQSAHAQKVLNCKVKEQIDFSIPDTDYNRCFISFEKINGLSKKYPRQNGVPRKNPL